MSASIETTASNVAVLCGQHVAGLKVTVPPLRIAGKAFDRVLDHLRREIDAQHIRAAMGQLDGQRRRRRSLHRECASRSDRQETGRGWP
jgi:hypothetical protein